MPRARSRRHPGGCAPAVRVTGAYPTPPPRRGRPRPVAPRPPAPLASGLAAAAVLLASPPAGALLPHEEALRLDVPARTPVDVPIDVAAAPADVPDPGAPLTAAPLTALPMSEPVRIRVPALGTAADVVRLGLQEDGEMEVPTGAAPVGWYDRSPTPGELGPAVLAGHVDFDGQRGAFAGLRGLRPGDLVVVDRADGSAATFSVDRVTEPAKSDFPTVEVYGDIHHAGLRLITCGGDYDEQTGEYEHNVVVFARLVLG